MDDHCPLNIRPRGRRGHPRHGRVGAILETLLRDAGAVTCPDACALPLIGLAWQPALALPLASPAKAENSPPLMPSARAHDAPASSQDSSPPTTRTAR